MIDFNKLKAELTPEEGRRKKPYRDTHGFLTVGIGRNLDTVLFADDEIDLMYSNDVNRTVDALNRNVPWWQGLDDVRERALIDFTFNVGIDTLLMFPRFLAKLQAKDWSGAVIELQTSKWHRQVGTRAVRLEGMFLTGEDPS